MPSTRLVQLVAQHAVDEGTTETLIEGLTLFRVFEPVERIPGVFKPSVCVLAQGSKRAYLGGESYTYNEKQYLCCSLPIPAEGEITTATPERPVLGALLSLDTQLVSETVIENETLIPPAAPQRDEVFGLGIAAVDAPFVEALVRLIELLGDPIALHVLGPGRMKELIFAILRGPAGSSLHRALGARQDIARAIAFLNTHFQETFSIDDLAREAGMSRASFHRKFKEATALSPIQFVKSLRLNRAAMLLPRGGDVGEIAHEVGYSSVSQFTREFSRLYGSSPKRWATDSRAQLV